MSKGINTVNLNNMKHSVKAMSLLACTVFFCVCCESGEELEVKLETCVQAKDEVLVDLDMRDYSYSYWLNGKRKQTEDKSADVLCFESGYYGFNLDMQNLSKAKLGLFKEVVGFKQALGMGGDRGSELHSSELSIEIEKGGKTFKAVSCKAGGEKRDNLKDARLWEAGKIMQHYDLLGLQFEAEDGEKLHCKGDLNIVMWPKSLSLKASVAPSENYQKGGYAGIVKNGLCVIDEVHHIPSQAQMESPQFTAEYWVKVPDVLANQQSQYMFAKNGGMHTPGNFSISMRHGEISANVNTSGGTNGHFSVRQRRGAFKYNKWNHMAISYDQKEMRFYINGDLQGRTPTSGVRSKGRGPLMIGNVARRSHGMTSGVYDQIRLWNRALKPGELKEHAKNPQTLKVRDGLIFEEEFESLANTTVQPDPWTDAVMRIKLKGQGGGNSGIFLMDKYEVQIQESHTNVTYADGQAGALYGQFPPLKNASTPQGEWQSYDIVFKAPRYNDKGLVSPATITVIHNGVVIHNAQELLGPSVYRRLPQYPKTHPEKAPIRLQWHGDPIQYRNFWVREFGSQKKK